LFGKTRQAWYVRQWTKESREDLSDSVIVNNVLSIRKQMPRIGTRKLHFMLEPILAKHKISIGRDRLFDLLENRGLLVRRRKRKRVSTTNSNHPYKKYPNLINGLAVSRPEHLWVSDITYISVSDSFCYLSLVTDAYSRKIVGYNLNTTLKRDGPLNAIKMALESSKRSGMELIHHSDRGTQYCCAEYIDVLTKNGLSISMTEKADPYENAIAERVNGILKSEFILDSEFTGFDQAQLAVDYAVATYNCQRPHASCNYLTPEQAHRGKGTLNTRWKRRKSMI
jgi:putative transposase